MIKYNYKINRRQTNKGYYVELKKTEKETGVNFYEVKGECLQEEKAKDIANKLALKYKCGIENKIF